jgi:hypothetical protein
VGLHAISAIYFVHIVRPTGYRHNNVRRHFGYLCVRLFSLSLDNLADVEALVTIGLL